MMDRTRHSLRGGSLIVAAVLLVLAGLTARMLLGARQELRRAAVAAKKHDTEARVRHLRRAMAYYLPGNPWVSQAHSRLLSLARETEAAGQPTAALAQYRELRSAILSLRGLTRPYSDSLPLINRRIALLATPVGGGADKALADKALKRLQAPPEPHPGWALLGVLGFCCWTLGAFAMLIFGLRRDAGLVSRHFWPLLGLVVAGLGLFGLGLGMA